MYYIRKWYAIFPGIVSPRSGSFLADHYSWRAARRRAPRKALDAVVGALFRAWIPLRARQVARKHGRDRAWARKAARIAKRRFADPNDIFLFRIEDEQTLDGYIRRFEDAAFNKQINPPGWRDDCVLADKVRFAERCAERGVRHPTLFAVRRRGKRSAQIFSAPAGTPLLLKPSHGEGGEGIAFLSAEMEAMTDKAAFGAAFDAMELSAKDDWFIQERLLPHEALGDLALNALPTVRLTTFINEAGRGELVNSVFRFPSVEGIPIDNMKAGGILSSVELADGRLTLACKGYGGGDIDRHPVTGAAIAGRCLPDWDAARALVEDAHVEAFGEYRLIGWDVALTPDGPVLLEGNGKPGVLMPQRSGRRGLGDQRYGELLAYHLKATRAL
ncbi:MAG: sugar-transfer associated ATP-grasp domain-containing protein [Pseudomonadota bacterium]